MNLFKKRIQKKHDEIFTSLDIGSSKISCVISKVEAKVNSKGEISPYLHILGVGHHISNGIKGGAIIDLEALEETILNSIQSAEQAAGLNIKELYVSIPANSAKSHNLHSEIYLGNTPVNNSHIKRLLNHNNSLADNRYAIHVIPTSYILDSIKGIRDPKGMIGEKLGVNLHIVSAPLTFIRNLTTCVGRCHIDVKGFVASAYAAGLSTLVEDELDLGVTVIDMGAENTTLASFYEGNLINIDNIPIGGKNVTHDIARGLAIPVAQAERLKTLYGTILPSRSDDNEMVTIIPVGEDETENHQIPKNLLFRIIRARIEEIFEHVNDRIKIASVDPLVFQRIVLTGGTSHFSGMRDFAHDSMKKQVRLGFPSDIYGNNTISKNPIYSTSVGLLEYALQDCASKEALFFKLEQKTFWKRVLSWVKETS